MNTMLLKESDILKLISMQDVIDIVDKTFVDLGEGKTLNPTKLNLNLGDSEPTNLPYKASLNAMPAYIAWQDMAGQKWAGGWGKGRREIGRPFINALIMLVHPNYGDFLAVMDGAWITNMRTGAQTAVILRYLLKDKKDITVGELAAGQKDPGSVADQKLLVVPIGMGCLDVAVAGIAYRKAFSLGMGETFAFDE